MSIYAGPNTTKNDSSLVLHLDAANKRSYPGSGTTWYDLSGNGYHGTLIGSPTFNSTRGGTISFDGLAGKYVNLPYLLLSGTGNFTVNAWVQSTDINSQCIFANYSNGNLEILYGRSYIGLWLNNSTTYLDNPNAEYTTNPVNITVLRIGVSETRCYLNTILKKIGSSTSTIGDTTNFRIGSINSGGERFIGNIFNIQVYNRALSPQEIKQNYNSTRGRFGL